MREKLNCPNCGMPITSTECEYCGTLFYDFATLDTDKPTYVRIKYRDDLLIAKAQVTDFSIKMDAGVTSYWADNDPVYIHRSPTISMDFAMDVFTDDRGVMLERKKIEKEK